MKRKVKYIFTQTYTYKLEQKKYILSDNKRVCGKKKTESKNGRKHTPKNKKYEIVLMVKWFQIYDREIENRSN